jgi:nucleoside-diphosphate-sugar epimerase
VREAKADAICHLGGVPWATDHPRTVAAHRAAGRQLLPEDETFKVNTLGTYYILDAARRCGVSTVAMATSFFVLGLGFRISEASWLPKYLPIDEDHPLSPEDSYSLSKMLDEEILAAFSRAWGIRTVSLRLMTVYYEFRPDSSALIRKAIAATSDGRPPFNGWLYVDGHDAAQAFRLAIEATNLDLHERFFIASDRTTLESPREIVLRLYPELRDMAAPLGRDDFLISIERARTRLGYKPRYSWRA